MENKILAFNSLLFLCIIVSFLIYKNAYVKGKLTCNNYILNSYLYILLSILVVSSMVILVDKNVASLKIFFNFWVMLLLSFGFLFLTLFTDPRSTLLKHGAWVALMFFFGISMWPIYKITKATNTFQSTLATTFSLVSILTAIAFYNPNMISLKMGPILLVGLISGILLSIFTRLLAKRKTFLSVDYYLSYIFVFLFSLFVLYDTKKLQMNAKKCVVPDYVNESLNIFLDIMNLFSRLGNINSRK